MDMYSILRFTGFILFVSDTQGLCLFGEQSAGCVFQCHCQDSAPCNDTTGSCPGGCDGGVLGVSWRGSGCQTGNIALHKTAKQSSAFGGWVAVNAIDGRVDGGDASVCAHTGWSGPGWWEVDLGGLYKVYNITIHNRRAAAPARRLSQFWIAVRNSSTDTFPVTRTELCYENRTYGNPGDIVHIQCSMPIVGRHIRLSKYQDLEQYEPDFLLNFCEFVAVGHQSIDCSRCPKGKECNDVTGCTECYGAYQPDCSTACEAGNYGSNCKESCGKCRDNADCDSENGGCSVGCQLWYAGTQCKDYIELHGWNGEMAEVTISTNSSLEVSWQPLSAVRADLAQFYGYTFYYRISGTVNFTEGIDVEHNTTNHAVITELMYNTKYDIYIAPFRQMEGEMQHGMASPVIAGKTTCNAPEKPVILSIESARAEDGTHSIFVNIQPITNISARCDAFTHIFLEYMVVSANEYERVEISVNTTSYEIESLKEGSYSVRLTVVNNQNISATSDDMAVKVGPPNDGGVDKPYDVPEPPDPESSLLIIIIPSVVVPLVVSAVIVAVALVMRRRKRNKADPKLESHDQEMVRSDTQDMSIESGYAEVSPTSIVLENKTTETKSQSKLKMKGKKVKGSASKEQDSRADKKAKKKKSMKDHMANGQVKNNPTGAEAPNDLYAVVNKPKKNVTQSKEDFGGDNDDVVIENTFYGQPDENDGIGKPNHLKKRIGVVDNDVSDSGVQFNPDNLELDIEPCYAEVRNQSPVINTESKLKTAEMDKLIAQKGKFKNPFKKADKPKKQLEEKHKHNAKINDSDNEVGPQGDVYAVVQKPVKKQSEIRTKPPIDDDDEDDVMVENTMYGAVGSEGNVTPEAPQKHRASKRNVVTMYADDGHYANVEDEVDD